METAIAYIRVSTKSDAQMHSYEYQLDYWQKYIGMKPGQKFGGIYADYGISGKSMAKRPQLLQLLADARKKKFNVVYVKSVSRFARNTEDLLNMVRELRDLGIRVYFEKENIDTFDPTSEVFLTIAASIAENDLKIYSENQKWSIRKKYQEGYIRIGTKILGYRMDKKTNTLIKVESEAETVRYMYYVENSHPMIITQTMFDMVQAEKKRRTELRSSVKTGAGKYSSRYGFSGLLVCGDCGGKFRRFGRKLANGEYVPTWVCVNHQKDKHRCTMKPLKEMDIYDAYRRAVERLLGNADDIISIIKTNIEEEFATTKEESLEKVSAELIKKQEEIMRMFRRKSCGEVDDETYNQAYAELSREVMALQEQETKLKEMNTKAAIEKQKQMDILAILNEGKAHYMENEVMRMLIETIKVINKHSVEFQFKCGVNIIEKV